MTPRQKRKIIRTYRYVQTHPVGRWLLAITWGGLGLMTAMVLVYVPVIMERREVLQAAGCTWDLK